MRRTRGAILVALAALIALPAAPAQAVSRKRATSVALDALRPQAQRGGQVVVYGLRSRLGKRATVIEAAGKGRTANLKPRRRVWLFWEELDFGAFFEHPSRLLLVDNRTARVLVNRRLSWYPVVDGRIPPFLKPAGYYGSRYVVWGRAGPRRRAAPASAPPAWTATAPPLATAAQATALPPGAFANDCVLMIGNHGPDPRFKNSFTALGTTARRVGLRVFFVPPGLVTPLTATTSGFAPAS